MSTKTFDSSRKPLRRTFTSLVAGVLSAVLLTPFGLTTAQAAGPDITSYTTAPTTHPNIAGAGNLIGAGQVAKDWFNSGTQRDKWFGALRPSAFGLTNPTSALAWCIEAGVGVGALTWAQATNPAVAYLLWKWEGQNTPERRAAIQLALYSFAFPELQEGTRESRSREARFYPPTSTEWQMAQSMWTEATQYAGPYQVLSGTGVNAFKLDMDADDRGGTLNNVGVRKTSNGAWVPGFTGTLTINGPAVFEDTGLKTKTVTTTTTPLSYRIVADGTGDVRVDFNVASVPSTQIRRGTSGSNQDAVAQMPPSPLYGVTDTHPFSDSFQPQVTTSIVNQVVQPGDLLQDRVTFQAGNGTLWSVDDETGTYLPVTFEYQILGPLDTPPAPSNWTQTVADNSGIFQDWTDYTRNGGPGNQTVTATNPVTEPGYYTFVWRVRKANQPAQYEDLIDDDWTDQAWLKAETAINPWTPTITSQVQTHTIAGAGTITDTITVSGLPDTPFAGNSDWAGDPGTITHKLYGPYPTRPTNATQTLESQLLGTATTPAVNGDAEISFQLDRPYTGWTIIRSTLNDTTANGGRIVGVNTPAGDVAEQTRLITVSSTTNPAVALNSQVHDSIHIAGPVPAGATLQSELWLEGETLDEDALIHTTDPKPVSDLEGEEIYTQWVCDEAETSGSIFARAGGDMSQDCHVTGDLHVVGDLNIRNGSTLTVDGSLYVSGNVTNGGISGIKVAGVTHIGGTLTLSTSDSTLFSADVYVVGDVNAWDSGLSNSFPHNLFVGGKAMNGLWDRYAFVASMGGENINNNVTSPNARLHTGWDVSLPALSADDTISVTITTEGVTVPQVGRYYWREKLFTADGTLLHYGGARVASESLVVFDVTTTAQPVAKVGDPISDTAHVAGAVPTGATLGFELYLQSDSDDPADDVLIATLDTQPVREAGDYQSPEYVSEQVGTYYWVHILYDADGEVLQRGQARLAEETTYVLDMYSQARQRLEQGGTGTDVAFLVGEYPAGLRLQFEVYVYGESDDPTADRLHQTTNMVNLDDLEPATHVDEDGHTVYAFTSPVVSFPETGNYYWREKLFTADGTLLHYGGARVESESTEVVNSQDGGLAMTGFNPQRLALFSGGLMILGAVAVLFTRGTAKRREK